jgi:hypothetical protein
MPLAGVQGGEEKTAAASGAELGVATAGRSRPCVAAMGAGTPPKERSRGDGEGGGRNAR